MKLVYPGISREAAVKHWERVLATDGLPPASYEAAREALGVLRPSEPERTPGEDDR